ncbi:hypothetical protein C8R43DRAFT_1197229, partial [Mycena crocata]
MVNLLNITSLAGALTLVKIFDFQGHVINLSGNSGAPENAIISFPETPGALNEDWFISPIDSSTFTVQSLADSNAFISYAGKAQGDTFHSGVVASAALEATVFRMETVNSGAAVNFIDVSTNMTLTAWKNPDPATRTDPTTPLTMESLMNPKSFMQSFTVQLGGFYLRGKIQELKRYVNSV